MGRQIRRVAVIGTGPAGAIATDALVKEQAFDTVRVFERKAVSGGTWVYAPDKKPGIPSVRALLAGSADTPIDIPTSFPAETECTDAVNNHRRRYADTGIHAELHSNLPAEHMAFTQEPIPAVLSDRTLTQYGPGTPFRHREVIRQWVENLFRRDGHLGLVSFSTTVERAEKTTGAGGEWVLTLRREVAHPDGMGRRRNQWWQETFDAVVVANGRYSLPYLPDIPGLADYAERFPGRIRHSKHFRSADDFAGKRVVVVGGSVSAFDALHEIRRVAQRPVVASLHEPLPAFGWGAFVHPHVQIRPHIVAVHADGAQAGRIEFADGSVLDGGDDEDLVVLFATGYDVSCPFLPTIQTTRIRNRCIRGLYQHVFDVEDPSLAFLGMITGGLTFRAFEWQAVAVARLFAGRAVLPPADEMRQWEKSHAAERGEGGAFCSIAPAFREYFEGLRRLAGEPAAGTTGRVLPRFEQAWTESFSQIVWLRQQWWERERRKTVVEEAAKL
ncbi:hypothetical protein SCUCBS95973_003149 [Sporothrix curviconia]|uniref:Thiol-specific monooxygenase n=1 Tax=Sporothrix curviconia TaxID=1260050 RepID=A0ABP0BDZ2_9PEZI